MSILREFLHDIKMSFWIALVVLVVYTLIMLLVLDDKKFRSEARIRFYNMFATHEKKPAWDQSLEDRFVELLRTMFLRSEEETQARVRTHGALRHSAFESFRVSLARLNIEQQVALIERDTSVIDALQEQERQYQAQVRNAFSWSDRLWPAFFVWQIASVICLLCWWWNQSFVMSYFPHRAWWFWIYIFITLPWSVLILMIIASSHFRYNVGFARLSKWRKAHREYDQRIADIMDNVAWTRQEWGRLFLPHFRETEIRRLDNIVPTLRCEVDELGLKLEKAQERYFTAIAQRDLLNKESACDDNSRFAAREEEWNKEFDRILSDPHIRGVHISDSGNIQLYTDTFQSSSGGVGPFIIRIDLLYHTFNAKVYDNQSMHNSTGLRFGRQEFCFGNMYDVITDLIRNYRVSEAVTLILHSLQTNVAG
ncbi:MAG: hypothetical protein G01um101466_260 [Parcubacteria group bacterium Gr01-1014_66]|nr:MAG: hypothetical protein G01um101466_260 [Parcubacteria group bacterium Gr01-1014_66]